MSHPSKDYRAEIEVAASRYGLDPDVVEAIVRVESSGLTHAFRHEPLFYEHYLKDDPEYDGALPIRVSSSYGLMQVMYPVAKERGFTNSPEYLFVPNIGLDYGCKQLAYLLGRTKGDLERAIVAYNGGIGNARTKPFKPEHAIYLAKVKRALDNIKAGN